jgi:uncharacterized OB-fold protein
VSSPQLSTSSAVEQSTQPFEDLLPRDSDVSWTGSSPHLVGSECRTCGTKNFPRRIACVNCGGVDIGECELAATGTLYTHTTVHISSSRETPYNLAYIDLADGVRILADVTAAALAAGPDTPVVLTADGSTWRFDAAGAEGAAA